MRPLPRSFVAVTTTGSYCEPRAFDAPPSAGNVLRFPTAAETDAFRANLRCRPYRAPVAVSWTGSELTCRAVRLILAGALDGHTEADLAARLGVSARHLRRLFTTHLGLTPAGLARSARAHFARRLLDDTDLPITEVAYAAGFGSLRQFNRACQEVFRASPRELRTRRRSSDPLEADGGLALRLAYRGPLDWDAMVEYIAAHAIPGVETVRGRAYHRTVYIDREAGRVELGPGGDDHLILRVRLSNWAPLIHLAQRARQLANLDLDVSEPVEQLAADEMVGSLVTADPGLRPPGAWDGFEIGVRAILEHETSGVDGRTRTGRLVERLGTPIEGAGELGLHHAFPSPATVTAADLAGLGIPATSGSAVQAFARAVTADAIRLDRSVSLDHLVSSITSVTGIGSEVAHDIAFRLGEPDAWPIVSHSRDGDGRSAEIADEVVDRWQPWRSIAAIHLWRANTGPKVPVPAAGRMGPHDQGHRPHLAGSAHGRTIGTPQRRPSGYLHQHA